MRSQALQDTGTRNHFDRHYQLRFRELLNQTSMGQWLLDRKRRSYFHAIKYLGEGNLGAFISWLNTLNAFDQKQRAKWRNLQTLVNHFRQWQSGEKPIKDRRTAHQKDLERVRTECNRAIAAKEQECAEAISAAKDQPTQNAAALWRILERAGPAMVADAIKQHDHGDFAEQLMCLFKEPSDEIAVP